MSGFHNKVEQRQGRAGRTDGRRDGWMQQEAKDRRKKRRHWFWWELEGGNVRSKELHTCREAGWLGFPSKRGEGGRASQPGPPPQRGTNERTNERRSSLASGMYVYLSLPSCVCVCLSVCDICPIFFSLLFCSVFASPPTPRYLVLPPIAPTFSRSHTPTHSFIHSFIHSFFLSSFLGLFLVALFSHSLTLACLLAFFLSFFRVCCYSSLLFPSPFLFFLGPFLPALFLLTLFFGLKLALGFGSFFFLVGFPLPSLIACQALSRMSPLFVCLYFGVSLFCFFSIFCISGFLSGTFRWWCGIWRRRRRKEKSGFVRVILLLLWWFQTWWGSACCWWWVLSDFWFLDDFRFWRCVAGLLLLLFMSLDLSLSQLAGVCLSGGFPLDSWGECWGRDVQFDFLLMI